MAAEANKEYDRATVLYDLVSKTDPSFATACFGLARCYLKQGDRGKAIEALARIQQTSSLFTEAQKATALTLLEVTPSAAPGAAELSQAAKVIEKLALAGMEGYLLVADMFGTAVQLFEGRKIKPDPKVTLLGQRLDEKHVRAGLEKAYREMALLETDPAKKVALVDLANQVRPRTWL
jgi:serine/threonine-protein kinase PknG